MLNMSDNEYVREKRYKKFHGKKYVCVPLISNDI